MTQSEFKEERVCKLLDEKGHWKMTVKAIYDGRGFYKYCILALAKFTPKSKWIKLNKNSSLEIYE